MSTRNAVAVSAAIIAGFACLIGFIGWVSNQPPVETNEMRDAKHQVDMVLAEQQSRHTKAMLGLAIKAEEQGDHRLAAHIKCQLDPPKKQKNIERCAELANYYARQDAAKAEREKRERDNW